ncbi:hypothetical protein U1Q18_015782 [Sarracenia purpurea var. burkii]
MSASGGVTNRGGEDRFYSPPAMRRHYQQQQPHSRLDKVSKLKSKSSSMDSGKRIESDDCVSSTSTVASSSFSPPKARSLTNLDRFLEHTTPIVSSQCFSKTNKRGSRTQEDEFLPYFILEDLWESFREWSAYGAGVPLVLNEGDSVVQYYVPYLSGIQLYIDPSKPSTILRRPGEDSDPDSSRGISSDNGSELVTEGGAKDVRGAWNQQNTMRAFAQSFDPLSVRINPFMGSTVEEGETSNRPGLLIFEYLEQDPPFSREPLANKIAVLASQFPELKTYRSCDLTPASWISVAWYPIYRIPTGPTLQSLDACFLTFHFLSTPFTSTSTDRPHIHVSTARELHGSDMSFNLSLPIFGLAFYKFKVTVWNQNGVYQNHKASSLLRTADNWLYRLRVDHPDYKFFVSHNSFWK